MALAQSPGNSTERLATCSNTTLPQSFTQYLNTSFLGERQFIQVGPVNYTFFQFGPLNSIVVGRPLIMVSGQGATATVWTPDLLQTLAQGRQVTVFTNRGVGYSTDAEETESSSVSGYADSTVDLIEALELEQPDLLGWSLGGDIALYIAEFYPDMVNRVVVADTTSGGLLGYSAASQALAVPLVPVHLQGLPVPATYIFPDNDPGNAGLCRFEASLAAMPKEPVTPQQIAGQNSAIYGYYGDPQSTVYHALGNITTEVLVIAGTLDEVCVRPG